MRVISCAAIVIGLCGAIAEGQEPVLITVQRAAAYVADYHQRLAMVVAQEKYYQEVRYPAPVNSRTRDVVQRQTLLSDFLLVRSPDGVWVPFRDVFEADGRAIRDRQERLSALFLSNGGTAFEQARKISEESSRYNIGSIDRNINVPTLPLEFVGDGHRARFSFEYEGGSINDVRIVRYEEVLGPTYIRTTNNGNLPATGRYWIHVETGRIERTELHAASDGLQADITVVYEPDEQAGLWVPVRMEERYVQKNDRSEIRGTATYSRFRRFQITTADELKQ